MCNIIWSALICPLFIAKHTDVAKQYLSKIKNESVEASEHVKRSIIKYLDDIDYEYVDWKMECKKYEKELEVALDKIKYQEKVIELQEKLIAVDPIGFKVDPV